MPLEVVEYAATVRLEREVVYETPDDQGMVPVYISLADVWSDERDGPDHRELINRMPEESWGWFMQERLRTEVEHDGDEVQLTSLPTRRLGTVFVDARMVPRKEAMEKVKDQREYVNRMRRSGRPVGKLPHGTSWEPVLFAMERGDEIVETRNGHLRDFVRSRGDSILETSELG